MKFLLIILILLLLLHFIIILTEMIYILVCDKKFIMVEIYWVLCQPLTMYYNSLILHLLRPVKKAYPGRGQSSLRQGNLRCLGMLALSSLFSTLLFLFSF